jgi:preprotein translocase subunit SecD
MNHQHPHVLFLAVLAGVVSCGELTPIMEDSGHFLEFRSVSSEPKPGFERFTLNDEVVYLDSQPVVTDQHVASLEPTVRDDGLLLELNLTESGRARLSDYTRQNTGTRLALVLDSEIRSAPVIASEIQSPLQIKLTLDPSASEELATQIRARW